MYVYIVSILDTVCFAAQLLVPVESLEQAHFIYQQSFRFKIGRHTETWEPGKYKNINSKFKKLKLNIFMLILGTC